MLPFRPVARIAIPHVPLKPLIRALEERRRSMNEQDAVAQSQDAPEWRPRVQLQRDSALIGRPWTM